MVWKGPDSFLVTGLSHNSELTRSILRFKSAEVASSAASAVQEIGAVIEEPRGPAEEIEVQVRHLYTLTDIFVQLFTFSIRMIMIGVVFSLFFYWLDFPIIVVAFVALYLAVFVASLLARRRKIPGLLRFEGKSFAVRTAADWVRIIPKTIEWKNAGSFILKGSGTKFEVFLPTDEEARRVVQRIKMSFTEIKEYL